MNQSKAKNNDGTAGERVKFERIRIITGYLVGTIDHFNDGKKAEVRDGVKHKMKKTKNRLDLHVTCRSIMWVGGNKP